MKSKMNVVILVIVFFIAAILTGGCKLGQEKEKIDLPNDEIPYPASIEGDPDPVQETNNLTIGWINRLPVMDYVWNSPNPAVDGWPAEGQQLVWRAYIKNWSSSIKQGITFRWLLDGSEVASGTLDIQPGQYAFTDFTWTWTFDRHILDFVLEPESAGNNHLAIYTDSITVGLYVEQRVYDYFHENQNQLGIGSNSFEGWAQRQMRMWNDILANAIYPETPNGVEDRMRIDKITLVPDGSLPLVDAAGVTLFNPAMALPNLNDQSVDMQWGFPVEALSVYYDPVNIILSNQFFYSGYLQHELGHARYLVDVYGFNVYHGTAGGTIEIMEDGVLVAGSKFLPGQSIISNNVRGLRIHETVEKGMMNTDWTFMDRYSAICMNMIAGHRATLGNFNAPENIGIFLNDLPSQNRFTITDEEGYLLKNAGINIYQASAPSGEQDSPYPRVFDNNPDMHLTTDDNGQVLLGRCPFSWDGVVRQDEFEFSNTAFIMRVDDGERVGYKVIDVSRFNLEYWRGNTDLADYTVPVTMH
jgi:hypothetical protein